MYKNMNDQTSMHFCKLNSVDDSAIHLLLVALGFYPRILFAQLFFLCFIHFIFTLLSGLMEHFHKSKTNFSVGRQ